MHFGLVIVEDTLVQKATDLKRNSTQTCCVSPAVMSLIPQCVLFSRQKLLRLHALPSQASSGKSEQKIMSNSY